MTVSHAPGGVTVGEVPPEQAVTITADGERLVYVAGSAIRLVVDGAASRKLVRTGHAKALHAAGGQVVWAERARDGWSIRRLRPHP